MLLALSFAGMGIAALGAGLAALGGVEFMTALLTGLEVDVGGRRRFGSLTATVLAIPFRVGDCGEIPVGCVLHRATNDSR